MRTQNTLYAGKDNWNNRRLEMHTNRVQLMLMLFIIKYLSFTIEVEYTRICNYPEWRWDNLSEIYLAWRIFLMETLQLYSPRGMILNILSNLSSDVDLSLPRASSARSSTANFEILLFESPFLQTRRSIDLQSPEPEKAFLL